MPKEITRSEAIALITAAVGTVYSECFNDNKRELSNSVRRAMMVAGQVRNTDEKSRSLIKQMTELNTQIGELSSEATQVLKIFDDMVAMSSEGAENLWSRIHDLECEIASKDRVIASGHGDKERLKDAQKDLGLLQIKHRELQESNDRMSESFQSNANKLIERVKEVNQLKAENEQLKKKAEELYAENCGLKCKVGSEDYARKEWKRKYLAIKGKYDALAKACGLITKGRKKYVA
jgi:chromosome segregation ATPase